MDADIFTKDCPGELLKITYPHNDFAFLPHSLPPKLILGEELVNLLISASRAISELNGIGQTLPDPNLLLRPLQSRESLSSSSIEGTYVTPTELLQYELDPVEPHSAQEVDRNEVYNYQKALELGINSLTDYPFGNHLLKSLHAELMKGVRGEDKSPGDYRRSHVQLGAAARYVPPPATHVRELMDELFAYSTTDQKSDPLIKAFLIHYQFESIHPFADGNGRVGRLLLTLMIAKWLGHAKPWLYMSAYFEEYRAEYVEKMFNISAKAKWGEWLEFCLHGAKLQAEDSIRRCKLFQNLRNEYYDRLKGKSKYSHQIIDMLFRKPGFHISDLAEERDIAYNTAKKNIEIFVEAKILEEAPDSKAKLFVAPEILRIANAPRHELSIQNEEL